MIYRFGKFELDSSIFELRNSGVATSVEPQVFNFLLFLIENRDRVVSRDEVIKAVWDGLDEFFCDGLAEDIISNLSRFSEIRVIASGSSFQFNDRSLPLTEIATRLHAGYIVDGCAPVRKQFACGCSVD